MFLRIKLHFLRKKQYLPLGILETRLSFWKPILLLAPSLLAIILFTLIPFIITFSASFTVLNTDANTKSFGIGNYQTLVQLDNFKVALRNSLVYTVLAVPLSLITSLLISSAIVHIARRYLRDFWLSIFFMPYVTSATAVAVAFFYMFSSNHGLINLVFGGKTPWLTGGRNNNWYSLFAILINGVWGNLAFQILILTTAMLSVNKDLYKSASIDGASKMTQFFNITLPSINRTLKFLITIGIIGSIKVFPLALFDNDVNSANNNNGTTLLLLIYSFTSAGSNVYYQSGAISILVFLISVLTTICLNIAVRVLIKGSVMLGDYRVKTKINAAKLLY